MLRLLLIVASMAMLGGATKCTEIKRPEKGDALLIIDAQNCFMKGGSLEVSGSDNIVDTLNAQIKLFENYGAPVVVSLDWHPSDHCSFTHTEDEKHKLADPLFCETKNLAKVCLKNRKKEFCADKRTQSKIKEDGGTMLWPAHCVADIAKDQRDGGTSPQLWKALKFTKDVVVVKKAFEATKDAYSASEGKVDPEAGKLVDGKNGKEVDLKWENTPQRMREIGTQTLEQWARAEKVTTLWLAGIATDFCVQSTAEDIGKWDGVTLFQKMRGGGHKPIPTKQLYLADAMVGVDVPKLDTLKLAVDAMSNIHDTQWGFTVDPDFRDAWSVCVFDKEKGRAEALKIQKKFKQGRFSARIAGSVKSFGKSLLHKLTPKKK